MAKFREQAERFGTRILDVDVDRVDFSERPFRVWARGDRVPGRCGHRRDRARRRCGSASRARRGSAAAASRACATCDGFFFRDKEIAVVGGGDTALEEATYLTRFATKVHLLHRRDAFRASKIMVDRAIDNPKIEIHTNTAVDEVLGDAKVEGLRLRDTRDRRECATSRWRASSSRSATGPNTEVFQRLARGRREGLPRRPRRDGLEDRGRVHRRRRPRPPLPPGRHRRRRRLQGRDRRRALARVRGHQRGHDRHRLVAPARRSPGCSVGGPHAPRSPRHPGRSRIRSRAVRAATLRAPPKPGRSRTAELTQTLPQTSSNSRISGAHVYDSWATSYATIGAQIVAEPRMLGRR